MEPDSDPNNANARSANSTKNTSTLAPSHRNGNRATPAADPWARMTSKAGADDDDDDSAGPRTRTLPRRSQFQPMAASSITHFLMVR